MPIPLAVRCKAYVRTCSTAGIAGSEPADGMDIRLFCLCCVGSGLCDEMITRSEESYMVCVCPNVFDLETSTRFCATEKSNNFVNMRLL